MAAFTRRTHARPGALPLQPKGVLVDDVSYPQNVAVQLEEPVFESKDGVHVHRRLRAAAEHRPRKHYPDPHGADAEAEAEDAKTVAESRCVARNDGGATCEDEGRAVREAEHGLHDARNSAPQGVQNV